MPMVRGERDVVREKRWLLLLSCVFLGGSVAVLVTLDGNGWAWPLFAWGVAVGMVGAVAVELSARSVTRVDQAAAQRWQGRRVMNDFLWLWIGATAAVVAAGLDLIVVDVLVTLASAISVGGGLVVLAKSKKQTPPPSRI
ncbi:MAG: hypothetical protein INR66_24345 [Gordonia polyisoprenivorans]|nr:hypothetical protein [Gordonia polyisoprenivorans]